MTAALLALGFVTALLSGVAGIGGGTVLIAALFALGLTPAVAVPLHAAVQLVANGTRTVAYARHVDPRAAAWFLLAALPAPFAVASLAAAADPAGPKLLLGLLILLSLLPAAGRVSRLPPALGALLAGAISGGLGMLVGATGVLAGRLLPQPGWDSRRVVATLALCQSATHLSKIAAFASVGAGVAQRPDLLWPLVLAAVLGTVVGRLVHGRIGQTAFRRLFRLLLALLALHLVVDACLEIEW